jgi:hypothetical protein
MSLVNPESGKRVTAADQLGGETRGVTSHDRLPDAVLRFRQR